MRPYEVMVIFDAGTEPPVVQTVVDRTIGTIGSTGGNPGAIERWGKRPFAYEVNHKREGYYVLVEFTADPPTVAELDRQLALTDEVVRHKVIRLPDKVAGRPRPAKPAREPRSGSERTGGSGAGAPARAQPAEPAEPPSGDSSATADATAASATGDAASATGDAASAGTTGEPTASEPTASEPVDPATGGSGDPGTPAG